MFAIKTRLTRELLAQTALDELDGGREGLLLVSAVALDLDLGAARDAGGHESHRGLAVDLLVGGDNGDLGGELAMVEAKRPAGRMWRPCGLTSVALSETITDSFKVARAVKPNVLINTTDPL